MKVVLAIFELLVGLSSGLATLFLLGSLAGISTPVWSPHFFFYWGRLFAGPLLLVIGAALILVGAAERPAAILMILGSTLLTCWAIYLASSILAERARGALNPGLVLLVGGVVVMALASALVAYKIYRLIDRMR